MIAAALVLVAIVGTAQPRHAIHRVGAGWALEDLATNERRPFDMWISRLANAAFDARYTDAVIEQLDDYKRYGINTIVVSLQGGAIGRATYPRVFHPDGALDLASPVYANLRELLRATDERGMVVILQVWYFNRVPNVPTDKAALRATRNAVRWFRNTGYRHFVYDLVNELGTGFAKQRALFSTLPGAIALLDVVRQEHPGVLVGMSPSNGMLWPSGPVRGTNRTVRADFIVSHNQVVKRTNLGGYLFGSSPAQPANWPYMNNEFWVQIPYERVVRRNPRTGANDFGHFIASETQRYITDLQSLRADNAFGNVHSRRQQHVALGAQVPVATVGPDGTQPEQPSSPAEPSLHWLFRAIATMRKFGPLAASHDFNDGHAPGFEFLSGAWNVSSGTLRQLDHKVPSAFARFVGDAGDFVLVFDAAFEGGELAGGELGVQFGDAHPAGESIRLTVEAGRLAIERIGQGEWRRARTWPGPIPTRFRLEVIGGRIRVVADGATAFDVAEPTPPSGRNVSLFTRRARVRFDNLRFTPVRRVSFDDGKTGDWVALSASHWRVVDVGPGNRAWRATVAPNETRRAVLDRNLDAFALSFDVDLSGAGAIAVILKGDDVTAALPKGYVFTAVSDGTVVLGRSDGSRVVPLASAAVAVADPSAIRVELTLVERRVVARIDGVLALDVTDTGPRVARGGVAIAATPGTTRIDDLELRTGPNRAPTARVVTHEPNVLALEFADPDGVTDLSMIEVAVGVQAGFVDVTPLVVTEGPPFVQRWGRDGLRVAFIVSGGLAQFAKSMPIRVRATDAAGLRTETVYTP